LVFDLFLIVFFVSANESEKSEQCVSNQYVRLWTGPMWADDFRLLSESNGFVGKLIRPEDAHGGPCQGKNCFCCFFFFFFFFFFFLVDGGQHSAEAVQQQRQSACGGFRQFLCRFELFFHRGAEEDFGSAFADSRQQYHGHSGQI
jgi:hypothetical protein